MTTSTPEGPLAQPPQWHARPVPFRVEPLRRWLHAAWDEFVSRHSGGWMWHLTGWIEYQRAYARGAGEDHSFAVLDESHRIVAVAPMFIFRPHDKSPELSYAGDPLPCARREGGRFSSGTIRPGEQKILAGLRAETAPL